MPALGRSLSRNSLLLLYVLFNVAFLICFVGVFSLHRTPASILVGTLLITVGSVCLAFIPAYLMAGVLSGILRFSPRIERLVSFSVYLLAGMPSIFYGIVGFVLFCQILGMGWSILSASLTLALMLIPLLITGFVQILGPMNVQYQHLVRSLDIGTLAFLFRLIPRFRLRSLLGTLQLSWSRAIAETAAVMLTCGVVLDMPRSAYDSVRVLSYHIYLLAMDEPGGMPEAKTLSMLLVVVLVAMNLVTQGLGRVLSKGEAAWQPLSL